MHTCTRLVRANVKFNVSFTGEFSPDFDLKNMIFNQYKGFFIEKMTQICQILKIFFFKLPDFYDKFQ